ncbi:hypothetical protein D9757_006418 [Collybiopsis confluens]|uniref:Hydrophobin n=1 Tax=Collybiopsis confluens TaxID=2823264 RepID=A0A8H5HJI6_9AGAR|nr:hypothetical protein D9757_006418 [Collybiopsis confluens]
MQFKCIVVAAIASAVVASPVAAPGSELGGDNSSSSTYRFTGAVQCCNTVKSSSDPDTSELLGLLGVHSSPRHERRCRSKLLSHPWNRMSVCCEDNSYDQNIDPTLRRFFFFAGSSNHSLVTVIP